MSDEQQNAAPAAGAATEAPAATPAPKGGFPEPKPPAANLASGEDLEAVARGAALLASGELVAFPTETVYGLGADARSDAALAKLYAVKKRPGTHPVIVHLADAEQLSDWAAEVPPGAMKLATRFWPGPLTLILKRKPGVSDALTGGQDTVGLRVPSHPVSQALLRAFGGAIAAPSANRFGRISPTRGQHVIDDLGNDVALVLDGGPCNLGIESTIIDYSAGHPVLLRPGALQLAQIAEVVGEEVRLPAPPGAEGEEGAGDTPRVPGSHAAHYAPRARMRLMKRVEIIDTLVEHKGQRVAVLALEVAVPRLAQALLAVVPAVPSLYAKALYANLRALDASGADLILVELPPDTPSWAAVMDRLRRAAHEKALAPKDAARFAKLRERAAKKLVEQVAEESAPSAGPDETLAPDPTHYELPDEGGARS